MVPNIICHSVFKPINTSFQVINIHLDDIQNHNWILYFKTYRHKWKPVDLIKMIKNDCVVEDGLELSIFLPPPSSVPELQGCALGLVWLCGFLKNIFDIFIFILCVWLFYLHACMCMQHPQRPEEDIRFPWNWSHEGAKCWKANPRPLQECSQLLSHLFSLLTWFLYVFFT